MYSWLPCAKPARVDMSESCRGSLAIDVSFWFSLATRRARSKNGWFVRPAEERRAPMGSPVTLSFAPKRIAGEMPWYSPDWM